MLEKFTCECPFCKEAAKWPKCNPYSEHNAHEEAVRDALHQAERENVIKDEIIENLRKKLAKSEEKHKKATKMIKVLMKERENMITCLHNRMEKVDELLVKNAELKKAIKGYEGKLVEGSYIAMSEYDRVLAERNNLRERNSKYEKLYEDVVKKYEELEEKLNEATKKMSIAEAKTVTYERMYKAERQAKEVYMKRAEKPMYKDSQLHKDNLKTIYKLEQETKELKARLDYDKLKKEKEDYTIRFEFDQTVGDAIGGYISREKYNELLKEKEGLNDRSVKLFKENNGLKLKLVCEQSNREYFQNKFYDKCKECDRLADENEKLKSRTPVIIRADIGGLNLQTFVTKSKYDALEQKYWDAQRLIDKYAQSEEKTKEYLNALTELYFDECAKTRKDCPLFGGFRGGKIFGDHGETRDSEML